MNRRTVRLCKVIFVACMTNYAAFVVESRIIGGTAVVVKASSGHYYVGDHARLREVSRGLFMYSRIHSMSIYATQALGLASVVIAAASILSGRRTDGRVTGATGNK